MTGVVGSKAQVPNPMLKPLSVLVGRWKTEGSHGMLPDITLQGNTSFEWIENGAYLLMRSEIVNDSRVPSGMVIFGSDNVQKKLFALYFDSREISRILEVSVKGNTISWWHNQPGFFQRATNTVSSNGNTIVSIGELSKDGTKWEKDLELTYTRIKT